MFCIFFFNDTATTEIYTLSLHDALPILESYNNQEIIAEEVAILKEILESITRRMIGDEAFARIEEIIDLSEKQDYVLLEQLIAGISNKDMELISRYFSILDRKSTRLNSSHANIS